jgi:hypothetical protein
MLGKVGLAVSCALCTLPLARANDVRVWNATGTYSVSADSVSITGPGTFKMEALDGSGGLGYIASITVTFTGEPGPVTVYVVRDPSEVGGAEHEPGAAEVWGVNLSPATGGGTVAELRTTGNYGHAVYGATLQAGSAGTLVIGGTLVNDILVDVLTGALTIGTLAADVTCAASDKITISGAGPHTGNISLLNTYTSGMDISGTMQGTIHLPGLIQSGSISVGQNLGPLYSPEASWGLIIDGSFSAQASVHVGGDVLAPMSFFAVGGTIEVIGDQWSTVFIDGGGLTGSVYIMGDLADNMLDVHSNIGPNALVNISGSLLGVLRALGAVEGDVMVHQDVYGGDFLAHGGMSGSLIVDGVVSHSYIGIFDNATGKTLSGTMDIGGVGEYGTIRMGDLTGSITVEGQMRGDIEVLKTSGIGGSSGGVLSGSIEIGAELEPGQTAMYGSLTCDADLSGGVIIDGAVYQAAAITVGADPAGGDLSGTLEAGDCDGDISVNGDTSGLLAFHGSLQANANVLLHNVTGLITIDNDFAAGELDVSGNLGDAAGEQAGYILIDGSLGAAADLSVTAMKGRSCISVDYDGYDSQDSWEPGATIVVDGTTYTGNTPLDRVYEIQCLVGDVNNDGALNSFDITPFTLAVQGAPYDSAYPGLSGSRMYHADCNCDSAVNSFDIDAFVLKLTNPSAWYAQYTCENSDCAPPLLEGMAAAASDDSAPEMGPAEIAAMLSDGLSPDGLEFLISAAQTLAAELEDPERAELWAGIAAALSGE